MSLLSTLQQDMKTALKARETLRLQTIRMVISELKNEEKRLRRDLTEAEELTILNRQAKRRRESIALYREGGREELAAAEEAELKILAAYLPQQLSVAEVTELIKQAISESGAESKRDFGKVMKLVMPKIKGKFPGKEVKPLLETLLS